MERSRGTKMKLELR